MNQEVATIVTNIISEELGVDSLDLDNDLGHAYDADDEDLIAVNMRLEDEFGFEMEDRRGMPSTAREYIRRIEEQVDSLPRGPVTLPEEVNLEEDENGV